MEIREYCEVQWNDCNNATFVSDYETGELMFMNQAMEKKFQIFEDYTGKKAEDVIPFFADVRGYDDKKQVRHGMFLDRVFLCEMLNCNLRSKVTLLKAFGRKFIQTKYFLAPNSGKRQEAESIFEKSIAQCLEILSDRHIQSPIQSFLQLLGEFYSCQLTYILELDFASNQVTNLHLWTLEAGSRQKISALPDHVEVEKMSQFSHWLQGEHHRNIINLDKNENFYPKDSVEFQIMEQ